MFAVSLSLVFIIAGYLQLKLVGHFGAAQTTVFLWETRHLIFNNSSSLVHNLKWPSQARSAFGHTVIWKVLPHGYILSSLYQIKRIQRSVPRCVRAAPSGGVM